MNAALGVAGALLALGAVQVLPPAYKLMQSETPPNIRWWKVAGAGLIVLVFASAGAAAGLIGHPDHTSAFLHGLGWQSFFGGAIKSGLEAVRPPNRSQ